MASTSPPSFNIGSINLSGGTFSIVGRDQHNYTQHHYQTLPNPLLAPNFNLQPPPVGALYIQAKQHESPVFIPFFSSFKIPHSPSRNL
jgi:hypothetical protein